MSGRKLIECGMSHPAASVGQHFLCFVLLCLAGVAPPPLPLNLSLLPAAFSFSQNFHEFTFCAVLDLLLWPANALAIFLMPTHTPIERGRQSSIVASGRGRGARVAGVASLEWA